MIIDLDFTSSGMGPRIRVFGYLANTPGRGPEPAVEIRDTPNGTMTLPQARAVAQAILGMCEIVAKP